MSEILSAHNLEVGYPNHSLFKDLNFSINESQLICLMGENGCGKTTLLKTLITLLNPLSGQIKLYGKDLSTYSKAKLSSLISVVLTDRVFISHATVFEILSLGRYPHTNFWGRLSKEDHKIIDENLEFLEIKDLKNCFYDELSDGQRQKVLLGRAIIQDTPLLVLDEPLTFLDLAKKMELISILKELTNKKKAILFSSHDWDLALKTTNSVWLLDKELICGSPEDLILKNKFRVPGDKFKLDPKSGELVSCEKRSPLGSYTVRANDPLFEKWISHALTKKGLEQNSTNPQYEINAQNDEIELKKNNEILKFKTIESLINSLR